MQSKDLIRAIQGLAILGILAVVLFNSCFGGASTPEELAIRVWGEPENNNDSGITSIRFSEQVLTVAYHYYPFSDALPEAQSELADLFERVFREFDEVLTIKATIYFPWDDGYGNFTWRPCIRAAMSRATANRINWDSFLNSNLPEVCEQWEYDPTGF